VCGVIVRWEQCERNLRQNVDLLLLQLRERIKLMAEIAYPIEWFATRFTCEDFGFLGGSQCKSLAMAIEKGLTRSVTYRMYMFKAS
jgi:hypothetical protein